MESSHSLLLFNGLLHSHKRMQEDEGFKFNTVECLRGRLLAERQASKIANEEAKSISNKVCDFMF